jgi:broad specificity phosphatase PhoE
MDNTRNLDLIFVSPLNRTLQTADIIIKANKLRVRKVVVLPELTEVLSKICDFSGSLKEKRAKYSHFDFCEMDRLIRDS